MVKSQPYLDYVQNTYSKRKKNNIRMYTPNETVVRIYFSQLFVSGLKKVNHHTCRGEHVTVAI